MSRGVHVEKISETANEYGEKDQVFSYSIEPAKAQNQNVEVSLSYVDGTDCSDVMDYSLNGEEKQLTLSCKADFSKQVKAVLTSLSNKDAKATIILDYLMKPKNIKLKRHSEEYLYKLFRTFFLSTEYVTTRYCSTFWSTRVRSIFFVHSFDFIHYTL